MKKAWLAIALCTVLSFAPAVQGAGKPSFEGFSYEGGMEFHAIQKFRYADTTITYDDERLGAAVRAWAAVTAVQDGGLAPTANADIKLVFPDPWPFPPGVLGAAGPNLYGPNNTVIQCSVYEKEEYAILGVLIHEVGHCLGLGHSTVANAAMYPYCCSPIAADDIAGIEAIYGAELPPPPAPAPYKLRVPAVAADRR